MKSQALQQFVKKIFSDEKAKAEFEANPDRVLSRFDLTEQERKAILKTQASVGLITGGSSALEATLRATDSWYSPNP